MRLDGSPIGRFACTERWPSGAGWHTIASMYAKPPPGTAVVIAAFAVSGTIHLVRPQVFEPLVPAKLGDRTAWVYASGAVELACAAGLVTRQRWAPAAAAATLAVIWVGNVEMARRWQRSSRRPAWQKVGAWARLPLQVPLIVWAWQSPVED